MDSARPVSAPSAEDGLVDDQSVGMESADHDIDVKYAYGSIVKNVSKEALIVLAVSDVAAAAKLVK